MEFLLPILELILTAIQGISDSASRHPWKEKHSIGRKLGKILNELDVILKRATIIIHQIEVISKKHKFSDDELKELITIVDEQEETIRELALETGLIERDLEGQYNWFKPAELVVSVYGSKSVVELPHYFGKKGSSLKALSDSAKRAYLMSNDRFLLVRHLEYHIPRKPTAEFHSGMSDEEMIQKGWLKYIDTDLGDSVQRQKYIAQLRRQVIKLQVSRNALAKMIRTYFEIEEII